MLISLLEVCQEGGINNGVLGWYCGFLTREDLDKYGPVEDLHTDPPGEVTETTKNNQTNNSNKRKEITPNKPEPKKTKEDILQIELSDNLNEAEKDDDNPISDKNLSDTACAMDAESELAAKVIIKNNAI